MWVSSFNSTFIHLPNLASNNQCKNFLKLIDLIENIDERNLTVLTEIGWIIQQFI